MPSILLSARQLTGSAWRVIALPKTQLQARNPTSGLKMSAADASGFRFRGYFVLENLRLAYSGEMKLDEMSVLLLSTLQTANNLFC